MRTFRLLFNDEMARAIVEGRKTVTRRPVTPHDIFDDFHTLPPLGLKPPCAPGDLLIGRECWRIWQVPMTTGSVAVEYRSDGATIEHRGHSFIGGGVAVDCAHDLIDYAQDHARWRPSIHMPDAAARIRRRVVSVTVERVQDITEADAVREGVAPLFTQREVDTVVGLDRYKSEPMPWTNYLWHGRKDATRASVAAWPHQFSSYGSARDSFSSLWHSVYAAKGLGWDANPWVWRIEFSAKNAQDAAP